MTDYGHDLLFGTFVTPTNQPTHHAVEQAVVAERAGLDLVTFQDHPYVPRFHDTSTLLAYAAARTERVHLSGNVLSLPLRPPVVLAKAAAYWLDRYSLAVRSGEIGDQQITGLKFRDVQAVLAETPAGGERVLAARERRARFRLGQGELAAAEEEFREILDLAPEQPLAVTAMARGGLARLALARREHEAALLASRQALALLAQVEAAPGLRMQPELWRIHAEALARSGAMAEARDYARRALDVYRRHQHPDSPAIAEVEAFLAQLRLSH